MNNLKPFDLQKALAGEPVVTRDGRKVSDFHLMNLDIRHPLVGYVEGSNSVFSWSKKGNMSEQEEKLSTGDLFMALVKKKGWVNIYRNSVGCVELGHHNKIYSSEELAKIAIPNKSKYYIATVPIEWEE